jgi:hypothetical protein
MLEASDGVVSSKALRPVLADRGIRDARHAITRLKLFNFDDPQAELATPDFRYYHRGRSFYSHEAFRNAEAQIAAEAAKQAEEAETTYECEEETIPRRRNRQEEARVVKYVKEALESLYSSEYGPDVPVAFDVHNERRGTEFENVDAIAVHWRSDELVEVISVEVKLDFTAKLVQQANNYRRFSHRVWIALPVQSDEWVLELREIDLSLFEYVVEQGIGILACRRRQGNTYEVWPAHWPRFNQLDSLAKTEFLERYREVFEDACVVKPFSERWQPILR